MAKLAVKAMHLNAFGMAQIQLASAKAREDTSGANVLSAVFEE
jgi:hypothetical protein